MALTPCGCTQALEPDPATEFTICDNAGSPAFVEAGISPIAPGVVAMTVFFAVPKASVNYTFVELSIENTIDPDPIIFEAQIIERQLGSFRVSFTGIPDSGNYVLNWSVYVRSL